MNTEDEFLFWQKVHDQWLAQELEPEPEEDYYDKQKYQGEQTYHGE